LRQYSARLNEEHQKALRREVEGEIRRWSDHAKLPNGTPSHGAHPVQLSDTHGTTPPVASRSGASNLHRDDPSAPDSKARISEHHFEIRCLGDRGQSNKVLRRILKLRGEKPTPSFTRIGVKLSKEFPDLESTASSTVNGWFRHAKRMQAAGLLPE
jgi:hypothetical protein